MPEGKNVSTSEPVLRYEVGLLEDDKKILCELFANVVNPGLTCTKRTRITIEKDKEGLPVTTACSVEVIPDSLMQNYVTRGNITPKIVIKVFLNELTTDWEAISMGRNDTEERYTRFDIMDI